MKLLLDQGLPRTSVELLGDHGFDALHVGECGMARAADADILSFARDSGRIVVTLDADFHALLALSEATGPSVIRVRIEGLSAKPLAALILDVIAQCRSDLITGCMISVEQNRIRVRTLPVST